VTPPTTGPGYEPQDGYGGAPGYGAPGYGYGPTPGYGPPPGYGYPVPYPPDPAAPYGRDPMTGYPLSDKSKVAAGLLQIFLGVFGVGRFYTGHTTIAVIQLSLTLVGIVTSIIFVGIFLILGVQIWVLIDGIMLLAGRETDARGLLLRS
jgi:TM2 domain-containing membrane protein YozV